MRCQVKRCLMGLFDMIYSAGPNKISWHVCQKCWQDHTEGKINMKDDTIFDKERK